MHQRGLNVGEALNHVVTNLYQHIQKAVCIASIAARCRGRCGVRARRRRRGGCFVGDVVVIVGYGIVSVVLFGFIVVDNGVVTDIGNCFVVFVDGRILGVDIGQVGAVVLVDVAVPDVLVDGDAIGRLDCAFERRRIDVDTVAFGVIGVG